MRNVRRKLVEHNIKKRRLVLLTVGILVFIYLSFTILVGDNGLFKYVELRAKRDKLLVETSTIKKQNKEIYGELKKLDKQPELMEEFAREYGLTKDGELIFKFEDNK